MNGSICRRKAGLIRFKGPALYAPVLLAHFGRRGIFLFWFSLYKLGETSSPRCVKQLNLLPGDTSGFPVKPSPFRPGRSPSYGEVPRRFRLGTLAYLGCIFTGIEPVKMQRGFPPPMTYLHSGDHHLPRAQPEVLLALQRLFSGAPE